MQEIKKDLITYGIGHRIMTEEGIQINIRLILKIMKELDYDPPIELTELIPEYHTYFDKNGKYLQSEIPNFIEYKYERMRIMAKRAFKNNPDLSNLLKIIDIYYTQHIQAIESDSTSLDQLPEDRCIEITNISMAISKAIGGGNIDQSTANLRYKMISSLSIINNMSAITWNSIKQKIKPVEAIAIQTLCANCNSIANSQCKCGTTYCSENCKNDHWKKGHKDNCSAVIRSTTKKTIISKCAQCNIPASSKCICELVYYCNTVCQKAHRKAHKAECKQRCCEIQANIKK